MSLMPPGTVISAADMVLLSNRTATDEDSSSSTVSWVFFLDGHLEKDQGGTTSTPSPQEWWSAGVTAGIGNSYDVRCKSINSGPVFGAEAAAVGTYIIISATRTWTLTETAFPGDSIVATFQLVATGTTTPILAEADLTFNAVVESP